MYFVPSIQKEVEFKKITIEQFQQMFNNNFNIFYIKALKENILEKILLTNFDKEILLLQIHFNEIKEILIPNKLVVHPTNQFISDELYNIEITVPNIDREIEYNEEILNLNKQDRDIFLLLEIAKHIKSLTVNNTSINCEASLIELIKTIKEIPPRLLAKCITCIDFYKKQIKQYYKQNSINYKYSIDLLVP